MAQEPWGLACEAAQQRRGACREPSGPAHHEKPQPPQSLAPGSTLHQVHPHHAWPRLLGHASHACLCMSGPALLSSWRRQHAALGSSSVRPGMVPHAWAVPREVTRAGSLPAAWESARLPAAPGTASGAPRSASSCTGKAQEAGLLLMGAAAAPETGCCPAL